ncbi:UNVERIFIED_CONTAM: hypothetical protein GTU68_066812 [Idotea baltica]|nr:hypothetical protein [Idotea baltica]
MTKRLEKAGFTELDERASWTGLSPGQYYVTRNASSLIAFNLPDIDLPAMGINMMGAHTDSPCLQVKPQPERLEQGLCQLGVQVYGGALLNPWFDRDLSMAGRVSYLDSNASLHHGLVNFKKAIAIIPSLAIHLDRDANKDRTINAQEHLPPVLMHGTEEDSFDFRALLKQQLLTETSELDVATVLDYEISLYDTQGAAITGLNDDFISSARLDNLLSCFVGLEALLNSNGQQAALLSCSDHEEVGSLSTSGARGPFLESVLLRLCGHHEDYHRLMQSSLLISVDNAHAIHPNYADKHDEGHGPKLNAGPVIKTNANQRYATNSETSAIFRQLCASENVPVQDFVVRSDMGCGSTIGPISAGSLGVRTLDIGFAQFMAALNSENIAAVAMRSTLSNNMTRFFITT